MLIDPGKALPLLTGFSGGHSGSGGYCVGLAPFMLVAVQPRTAMKIPWAIELNEILGVSIPGVRHVVPAQHFGWQIHCMSSFLELITWRRKMFRSDLT